MSLKFRQIQPRTTELPALASKKSMLSLFLGCLFFHLILFILTGNKDMRESSEEFEIWLDPTSDCKVIAALERWKKSLIYLQWE